MRQLDMKRKQTSAWPWLAGLVVLGLAVWAATSLLAPKAEELDTTADAAVEDVLSPAALPMPANPVGITPLRSVDELAPLSQDDVGQRVRAEGEVLATGTAGFWMLAGSDVLRVESGRTVRLGQTVEVQGTLQEEPPERTDQVASEVLSRRPQAEGWNVARGLKLVEEREEASTEGERPGTGS
jgi:hypothetical protein